MKAGLFAAVLTGFIIDRNQAIQPTPAQQSAFFQQQSVVLLNQISQQLSSLGAQIPVPSDLSLPHFTLSPSASDVRVNVIWIFSLVSSLTAALLATLIRQWARDHMRIFQRYRDPLEVARIRQYLHEGFMRGHVPALVEAVSGLVHISLFLFFAGLADFLMNTYATVGRSVLVPIVLCPMIYIFMTVAPIMNPQSSYRTPYSPSVWFLWHITTKRWIQWRSDRFGRSSMRLNSKMAKGQIQLAMERSGARRSRDARAIRWLIDSLIYNIEDSYSLALGIPASFDTKWGVEVWRHQLIGTTWGVEVWGHPMGNQLMEGGDELFRSVGQLLETCSDRASFKSEDEWHVNSRACTEAVASFVFFMDVDISIIRNPGKLLSDIGTNERTREVPEIGSRLSFAICWTCLSLVATRKMLDSPQLRQCADDTLPRLAALHLEDNSTPYEMALTSARRIDGQFAEAWNLVEQLRLELTVLGDSDRMRGRIEEVLCRYEPRLKSIQDQLALTSKSLLGVDASFSDLQTQIDKVTHNLTRQLPGVAFDDFTGSTTAKHALDFLANPIRPQLIYFSQLLRGLCSVNQEWSSERPQDMVETLRSADKIPSSLRSVMDKHRLMERQLWRLEDLRIGGAFGFTLELYFLSIRQILSTSTFTSPPRENHKTLHVNTFRAITSDWQMFKHSIVTLQIILNLVYDITFRDRGIFSNFEYPDYIMKELLNLLGRMIERQEGSYIEDAMWELRRDDLIVRDSRFQSSAAKVIQPHEE